MQFVDVAEIMVSSGQGGSGAVSFRREKFVPKGGPDGGTGGKGGDVIVKASVHLQTLMDIRLKKQYQAQAGQSGRRRNQTGPSGEDLVLNVPVGTLLFDGATDTLLGDLSELGKELSVAKGGMGGKGNTAFRSSVNRVPRKAQSGLPGESVALKLELRLLAEVGLIGLPNAGKSTLLHALTLANAKIGAYPFTTKTPNLGVLRLDDRELVVADIPGLIEGASHGAGLGNDFLRHIDRTKVLVHLVSVSDQTPESCWANYELILSELSQSNYEFNAKPILTVLSQIDTVESDQLDATAALFKSKGIHPLLLSSLTKQGLTPVISAILKAYDQID